MSHSTFTRRLPPSHTSCSALWCVPACANPGDDVRFDEPCSSTRGTGLHLSQRGRHRCTYEEITLIHAQGDIPFTNEHELTVTARRRAGKIGANGLVPGYIDELSALEPIPQLNVRIEIVRMLAAQGARSSRIRRDTAIQHSELAAGALRT